MSTLLQTSLGEIAEFTNGGAWNQSEYADAGIPVVRVSDIHGATVDLSDCKYLSEASFDKYAKHELQTGDLIICTVGSHPTQPGSVVGRPGIVPASANGALLNQNAVCLRPACSEIDKTWLGYLGRSEGFHDYIKAHARGAANQVRMAIGLLKEMPVSVPDLPTQRRIAGILSAYDDLIENNLRRIRILEEMAQSLYREWFVHFRFPGHDGSSTSGRGKGEGAKPIPLVDSPLGPIPEGWEVKPVGECFEITGGGTPSKKVDEYWDGGTIQWYSPRDLTAEGTMFMEHSADQITELGLKKSSARMFPANSVMLTSRATIGAIAINTTPACTNQGFITCLPNDHVLLYFLYQWLKANVETFISHASGATFKEISKGVFRTLNILLPPQELVVRYEAAVTPISEQLLNLQRRNHTLRKTRDLLLPKLLSPRSENAL